MKNKSLFKKILFCFYAYFCIGLFLVGYTVVSNNAALGQNNEPIYPVPENIELDNDKVALGEKLFHDPRLSKNNRVSCASCHALDQGGDDGLKFSVGISGNPTNANAHSVFNIGDDFLFFWDGSAETLEDQIDGPITHPDEMGSNWKDIIAKLSKDKEYQDQFYALYKSPPTENAIKNAIATFERSLNTLNAPFDKYLLGDKDAISAQALAGYQYFKSFGCASCHQGQGVGGNMLQTFGVVGDYFKDRGTPITEADLGHYNVTGDDMDKHVFKVPSLRNVELTAPYFHDGNAETLEEAVDVMAKYQLGKDLSNKERAALVAFLKSLTGEYKGKKLNAN